MHDTRNKYSSASLPTLTSMLSTTEQMFIPHSTPLNLTIYCYSSSHWHIKGYGGERMMLHLLQQGIVSLYACGLPRLSRNYHCGVIGLKHLSLLPLVVNMISPSSLVSPSLSPLTSPYHDYLLRCYFSIVVTY